MHHAAAHGVGRRRHLLFGGVAAGVLFAIVQATSIRLVSRGQNPWWVVFALTLPSWLVIGLSLRAIIVAARRYAFAAGHRVISVAVHSGLSVAFAMAQLAAMSLTYMLFASIVPAGMTFAAIFGIAFRYLFFSEILAYWAFVGIFLAVQHSDLQRRLAEARLEVLRAQLNPHFLFNTLNAISALAHQGKQEAVTETLALLSNLLRAALDEQPPEVRFAHEMELVDTYLALQSIRFESRLRITKRIAPDALVGYVPPLVLQPIVENALEHGRSSSGIDVTIAATRNNGLLVLEVLDGGPGFPAGEPHEGTGLANVRARLEALYGSAVRIEFGNQPTGGAYVRLSLPFHATEG